jgi:site-specific recombinase XerD
MAECGYSSKILANYRYCGFGFVRKYFEECGCSEYADEILDEFLAQLRYTCEHGGISQWKWSIARRSVELLRQFVATGTVSLDALPKWEVLHNPLHAKPTEEQLIDNDNIYGLVWRTKCQLSESGLSAKTLRNYGYDGFDKILRVHMERGLSFYSPALVGELVTEARTLYKNGSLSRSMYQDLRKIAFLIAEFHNHGNIKLTKMTKWGLRQLSPEFAELLEHFCDNAECTGIMKHSSVKTASSAIRRFVFVLEDNNIPSPTALTPQVVSNAVGELARRHNGGLSWMLFSVRIFLDFLYETGVTEANLRYSVPELHAEHRDYRPGFTADEIRAILSTPDRETAIGKRDFAIMNLAAQTGLRAIDVVRLKRQNIDWRSCEIRITQEKTGKPLSLPLDSESGNAIADYLLNARPESDLPYIFLCHSGVCRPVDSSSASSYVTKYALRAGVDMKTIARRGFHSFRRAFGTRLLHSEVPLELLQQLLGHTKPDSLKPYLSIDERGLKLCALRLCDIAAKGGVTV